MDKCQNLLKSFACNILLLCCLSLCVTSTKAEHAGSFGGELSLSKEQQSENIVFDITVPWLMDSQLGGILLGSIDVPELLLLGDPIITWTVQDFNLIKSSIELNGDVLVDKNEINMLLGSIDVPELLPPDDLIITWTVQDLNIIMSGIDLNDDVVVDNNKFNSQEIIQVVTVEDMQAPTMVPLSEIVIESNAQIQKQKTIKNKNKDNTITVAQGETINIDATDVKKNKAIIGLDGGKGDDIITNNGDISVLLTRILEDILPGNNTNSRSNSRSDTGAPESNDDREHLTPNIIIQATGISGGKGNDTITNNGSLNVSNSTTSNVIRGVFSGDAIYATGISGGAGKDTIDNSGELKTSASSTFVRFANAQATGIDGGEGNDTIENSGVITTTADATAFIVSGGVSYARSDAQAISINGGEGDDTLTNNGTINNVANSTALTGEVFLSIRGTRPVDTTTAAIARSIAIDGGEGDDTITNSGTLSSSANASATGLFGSVVAGNGALFKANSGVSSDASATGIAAGEGNDTISNTGLIQVEANAITLTSSQTISIEGAAQSDSISKAISTATAIDGGEGDDSIVNQGELNTKAVATAGAANIAFSQSGNAQATHEGGAIAEAIATGISADGGASSSSSETKPVLSRKSLRTSQHNSETSIGGNDTLVNSGMITSSAIASSGALGGAISIEGAAQADTSSKAKAVATAIDGGAGDDSIVNQGELNTTAVATAVALNVAFSQNGEAQATHEGGATAEAVAMGITGDGGASSISNETIFDIGPDGLSFEHRSSETAIAGSDTLTNSGLITSRAIASSGALGGAISIEGAAQSDTNSKAKAAATAIDGGAGDDSIVNHGELNSAAVATAVALNIAFSQNGDAQATHEGGATAEAIVTGITGDGGASSSSNETVFDIGVDGLNFEHHSSETAIVGNDTITNSGLITSSAIASSGAEGGVISIEGAAQSDTNSKAKAAATAIDGGAGDDGIVNQGELNTVAVATAVASNVSISQNGDAKTTHEGGAVAEAIATGITGDGGASSSSNETALTIDDEGLSFKYNTNDTTIAGNDTLTNSGMITTSAIATGGAVGGSISIEGAALSDTSSKAKATATAIDSGAGDDEITNTGILITTATSTAVVGNISVTNAEDKAIVQGGAEAEATAVGIDADGDADNFSSTTAIDVSLDRFLFNNEILIENNSGDDTVTNDGKITAVATSQAPGLGAAVGVNGAASSMLTSAAKSHATAIDLGGGNDTLTTSGRLNAVATSTAVVGNISVTNAEDKAIVQGGAEAEATAVGIDADGDADNFSSTTVIDVSLDRFLFNNEILIENDSGDDTVTNHGAINAIATAVTPGLGVAVGVKGAAVSMLTSTSQAHATAIDLGGGNDTLTNNGQLNAVATSLAVAANIPVAASKGQAIALGGSEAEATAVGIDADGDADNFSSTTVIDVSLDRFLFNNEILIENDSGDDTVTNHGAINAIATAVTPGLGVAVGVKGAAVSMLTSTSQAHASAIDLGGGNDTLTNSAQLNAVATSLAVAANIPVAAGKDQAIALGGSEAEATAVGIDADGDANNIAITTTIDVSLDRFLFGNEVLIENDSGDDTVINDGGISAIATSVTPELDVPVAVKGVSVGVTAAKAQSQAVAIDLGGGDDDLTTTGLLEAKATSIAVAANVPVTAGTGAAIALGGPEAEATAVGIDADGDANNIAITTIDVSLDRFLFNNEILIENDSGDDTVTNEGGINAVATAVTPELDVAVAVKGMAFSETAAKAVAQAVAIDLGGGDDTLTSSGQLNAVATSVAVAANIPVTAGTGAAIALGGPEAEAIAVGIDADGDANNIAITTAIDVSLDRLLFNNEVLIENDSGDDTVTNDSDISAIATSVTPELDIPVTVKGVSVGVTAAKATTQAVAIDLGGGNDDLSTTGLLEAQATSVAVAANAPISAGTGVAIGLGGPEAEATAVGIDADGDSSNLSISTEIETRLDGIGFINQVLLENDSGNDTVSNAGDIYATATAVSPELDIPVTMAGVTVGVTAARARSQATAIDLGGGDDNLGDENLTGNTGQLNAKATSIAVAANIPVSGGTGAAIGLGGPEAEATAVGIDADGDASNLSISTEIEARLDGVSFINEIIVENDSGNDMVRNDGDINVIATAVTPELDAPITATGLTVGVTAAKARSQAVAIDLGGGDDNLGDENLTGNTGHLEAIATSIAVAANIPVSAGTGVAIGLGGPEAEATAVGIDADGNASNLSITTEIDAALDGLGFMNEIIVENDSGNDMVRNNGDIDVIATAVTPELDIPVTMAGVTFGVSAAKATAQAVAIDLGGGDDNLISSGELNAKAVSIAVAANIPVSAGTGAAIGLGGPEAEATAVGIDADGDASNLSISTEIEATLNGVSFVNQILLENDSGNDLVSNTGDIYATATAVSPELDVPVTMAGVTVGVSAAKATTQAVAIDLGGGHDDLSTTGLLEAKATSIAVAANIPISAGTGVAIGLGGPEAEATAVGIDADGDASNLSISTEIEARLDGASFMNEIIVVNDSGNDTVTSEGDINAIATSVAPELDVPVTMAGVAVGVSAAKAKTQAAAIDLGGGDDNLTSIGQLDAKATSIAVAANIPVSAGTGAAIDLGGPEAEATAVGIDADGDASNLSITTEINARLDGVSFMNEIIVENDSGDDTVSNDGVINAIATSVTPEIDVPVAVTGVAVGVSAAKARSQATAIDLGGGDDDLTTTGQLEAIATSVAFAANIPVTTGGVAIALGGPEAEATAVGIDADGDASNLSITTEINAVLDGISFMNEIIVENDSGNDVIQNNGDINAVATSVAPELDVAVAVAGVSVGVTDAEARAQATAIDLGGGDNSLTTTGKLGSLATSVAVAANVPVTAGTGLSIAWGGTDATATAQGIDANGKISHNSIEIALSAEDENVSIKQLDTIELKSGNDTIDNHGDITTDAVSVSPSISVAVTVEGVAAAVTTSRAKSEAMAIDTGDGSDIIDNHGALIATSVANADTVNVSLSGHVGANITGNAVWDGGTTAEATAMGISADGNGILFTNERNITLDENGITLLNRTTQEQASGNDIISNDANITASATAVTASVAAAGQIPAPLAGGISAAVSTSTAKSKAIAINAGGGDDSITNSGDLSATSNAIAVTGNATFSLIGGAVSADALWAGGTTTEATAIGIDADGEGKLVEELKIHTTDLDIDISSETTVDAVIGNDFIDNDGDITVIANAVSPSINVAIGGIFGAAAATSTAITQATAIDAGDGENEINNSGDLQATTTSTAVAVSASGAGGIALSVNNVWDGGTRAEADSAGILAGSGDDIVENRGLINSHAFATAPEASVALGGVLAAAISTSSSIAEATAIDVGNGENEVNNVAELQATATSTAVAVNFSNAGGVAVSVNDVWDGGTRAEASATGILAGDGHDTVSNEALITTEATATAPEVSVAWGVALGAAISTATTIADATAIDIGEGDNHITNTGELDAAATSTAVAVNVSLTAGISLSANNVWDGGTRAEASATGILSAAGHDTVTNEALITTEAVARAPAISVAAGTVGAAISTATAIADATAIDVGDGDNQITNTGELNATAASKATAVNVSLGLGALSANDVWDGGTMADAIAAGILSGVGDDTVRNESLITSVATATTPAVSVGVGMFVAAAITTATSTANSTAIDVRDGDDEIINLGDLTATATADAHSVGVGVTLAGVAVASDAFWDGGTTAEAGVKGIHAGAGNDEIRNQAAIEVTSSAMAKSTSVAGTVIGVTAAFAASNAVSNAAALDGGDGDDLIDSHGRLTSNASAVSEGHSVSVALIGAALADSTSTAEATALGIDGGAGDDSIVSGHFPVAGGLLDIDAYAMAKANSFEGTLGAPLGNPLFEGGSMAEAIAYGLKGEQGNDLLSNRFTIDALARAETFSNDISIGLIGVGEGATANASSEATARVTGIGGGADNDVLDNEGVILIKAEAESSANSFNLELAGVTGADFTSEANSVAVGLDGGDGQDTLVNRNQVSVDGSAQAAGQSMAIIVGGINVGDVSVGDASATTNVDVTGLDGGLGDDFLVNLGSIKTSGISTASGLSRDITVFGVNIGDASATANANVTGLAGGEGKDKLSNLGSIEVTGDSTVNVKNVGFSVAGYSASNAEATGSNRTTGISGGNDKDILFNADTGSIEVSANATVNANGVSITLLGASLAAANTSPTATALGIEGGLGDDEIDNAGTLLVDSYAQTNVTGTSFTIAGANLSQIGSGTLSTATGLDGGDGSDTIFNSGNLDVNVLSVLNATTSSWSLAGVSANDGNGQLAASSHAMGVSGGDEVDILQNTGTITVQGDSDLTIGGGSTTIFGKANADVTVIAETFATGMDGGAENDVLNNFADVIVNATANLISKQASFAFIGSTNTGANITANADALGFDGGTGDDQIFNNGSLLVSSVAGINASGKVESTIGTATASSTVTVDAKATGISAGEGNDLVINRENINTNTSFNSQSTSEANAGGIFLDGVTRANTDASSINQGVNLGQGQNEFLNVDIANINVDNGGSATSTAVTDGDLFDIGIDALATANTKITGNQAQAVLAANGNNDIKNDGKLSVAIETNGKSTANADGASLIVRGDGTAVAIVEADFTKAAGIEVGDGDNTISNMGELAVTAAPTGSADSISDADGINALSSASARVQLNNTYAIGIEAGEGNNMITNHGDIDVIAAPRAGNAFSKADFGSISASIDAAAHSTASANNARALGIVVGSGSNHIWNTGKLNVESNPWAKSSATAKGVGVDGDATATAIAEAKNALAVGIQTGDGHNTIVNDGEIIISAAPTANATAVAEAGSGLVGDVTEVIVRKCTQWLPDFLGKLVCVFFEDVTRTVTENTEVFGEEVENPLPFIDNARAIGIQTGSGNDMITNNGSIITFINGIEGAGIGITSGAGNDTVLLGDGSLVKGSINLGEHDDTLHLKGTPLVDGAILGGAGIDTLLFDGEGSFTSHFNAFEQASKQGTGTYRLAALETMKLLDLKQGTLQIDSNYAMAFDSRLQSTVYGDGSNGALAVLGMATLNGELVINKESKPYIDGTRYDVVVSNNNLQGSFASENLPAETPLLSFSVDQLDTSVQVLASANPIVSVANSAAEGEIAKALDSMMLSASGDISNVITEFQELSAADYDRAFASLNPVSYDSSRVVGNTIRHFNYGAQNRLANIRSAKNRPYDENDFLTGSEPVFFSADSIDREVTAPLKIKDQLTSAPRQNGWLVAFGNNNAKEDGHNLNNYNSSSSGISVGMDYYISPRFNAGISYGYANSDTAQITDLSASSIRSDLLSFYGNYMIADDTYLESLLTVGSNNYENVRFIDIGDYQQSAVSNHDSSVLSAGLTLGKAFRAGDWKMEVSGSLQYLSLNEAAFNEQGAGGINLHVNKQHIEDVSSELEWRAGYDVKTQHGMFNMQFNAAWLHDIVQDDRSLTVNFADEPGSSFTLPGSVKDRDGIRVGTAITFVGENNLSLTTRISTEQRSDYRDTTAVLQARWRF